MPPDIARSDRWVMFAALGLLPAAPRAPVEGLGDPAGVR
jgi:hypothetical protein